MNSLLNMLGAQVGNTNVLLQAFGAAMRGESPQAFLKKLANSDPRLKKVDLNDLMGSAQKLATENGRSIDDVQKEVDSAIAPYVK